MKLPVNIHVFHLSLQFTLTFDSGITFMSHGKHLILFAPIQNTRIRIFYDTCLSLAVRYQPWCN